MAHDNHPQFFTEILQLMYLDECADGIDTIKARHNLCIIPITHSTLAAATVWNT